MLANLVSTAPPSITDWIAVIISIITVFLALPGLYKLLQKDKERQQEISALTQMAENAQKQLFELSSQTAEFQKQTALLEKQYETERAKRLQEIAPDFIFSRPNCQRGDYVFNLKNGGGKAYNTLFKIEQGNLTFPNNVNTIFVGDTVDEQIYKMEMLVKDLQIEVSSIGKLSYSDYDGNKYEQTVILQNYVTEGMRPALMN